MKIKTRYNINKAAKVGDSCTCPSCGSEFVKSNYQQAFCKTRPGTQCKDKYWNTVTPTKYNNKTRISPASARFMEKQHLIREENFDADEMEHPFSSEALGQW